MNINRKITECKDRTNDGFCKCLTEQIDQIKQYKKNIEKFNTDYDKIQVSNYNKLKAVVDSQLKYQEGYDKLKKDLSNFEGTLKSSIDNSEGSDGKKIIVIPFEDQVKYVSAGLMFMKDNKWITPGEAIRLGCNPINSKDKEFVEYNSLFKIKEYDCSKDTNNPNQEYKYKYTKRQIARELEKYNMFEKPILSMPVLDSLPIKTSYNLNLPSIDCCGTQIKVDETDSNLAALIRTQEHCTETTPSVQENFESTTLHVKEKYKPTNTNTNTRINKGGMIGLSLSSFLIIVLVYFAYKYFKKNKSNKI